MKQLKVFRLFAYGVLLVALGGLLAACGMPMRYSRDITIYEPMREASVMKELELKVPQGKKKATDSFMVAFVTPSYVVASAPAVSPALLMQSRHKYKKADTAKEYYLESVRKSLQTDLDYILLQKGIRVLGTFKNHDEMTFDQKKRVIYTFTPEISISVDEQKNITSGAGYRETGVFIVRGYVTLLLRESITQEKLWVKRIEAQPVSRPYEFVAKFKDPFSVVTDMDMLFTTGVEEKDNSDKALADALAEFYASLGKKLWDHVDAEEWKKYLDQAIDVRRGKRY